MEERGLSPDLDYNKKRGIILIVIISVAIIILIVAAVLILQPKEGGEEGTDNETNLPPPDTLAVQCEFICETNQTAGYCDTKRNLENGGTATCSELATDSQYSSYDVQPCPTISCETQTQQIDQTCVSGLEGTWTNPNSEGNCPVQGNNLSKKRTSLDSPPVSGQICCYYYE